MPGDEEQNGYSVQGTAAGNPPGSPAASDGDRFPILVVEDDPVTRRLLERGLAKQGKRVVTAGNGREALERFREKPFPIVITDWMMPEMDGLQLCRAIRSIFQSSYTFIILLTAKSERDDVISGLDAGADDYLTKPFNQAELMARLRAGTRFLRLYERVKVLSVTDPLTQCYNRGYLMETLTGEIKRSARYKKDLSLVMSDIDHFKRINDTYGHQAGDVVLREFSGLVRRAVRDGIDWLARYGGEEFVLVLPETGRTGAWRVAERIRRWVAEMPIRVDDVTIRITASFGLGGFPGSAPGEEISADRVLQTADRALYRAKREGRNRVAEEIPGDRQRRTA